MPATYEPIASQTLGTSAATVEFTDIPSVYTDLVLVSTATYVTGGGDRYTLINVGSGSIDTGSNYSWTTIDTYSGSAQSLRGTSQTYTIATYTTSAIASTTPVIGITQFMSYANTNVNKTILSASAAGGNMVARYVDLWRSTAAINRIRFTAGGANYASGSTFSLYGIKAA